MMIKALMTNKANQKASKTKKEETEKRSKWITSISWITLWEIYKHHKMKLKWLLNKSNNHTRKNLIIIIIIIPTIMDKIIPNIKSLSLLPRNHKLATLNQKKQKIFKKQLKLLIKIQHQATIQQAKILNKNKINQRIINISKSHRDKISINRQFPIQVLILMETLQSFCFRNLKMPKSNIMSIDRAKIIMILLNQIVWDFKIQLISSNNPDKIIQINKAIIRIATTLIPNNKTKAIIIIDQNIKVNIIATHKMLQSKISNSKSINLIIKKWLKDSLKK